MSSRGVRGGIVCTAESETMNKKGIDWKERGEVDRMRIKKAIAMLHPSLKKRLKEKFKGIKKGK